MSTVKSKKLQVGTDATSSNNFTIYQPSTPDGTLRIGVGNADSPTEVGKFNINGYVPNKAPAFKAWINLTRTLTFTGSYIKVMFDVEEFDTDNCWDTTNSRFTPTVAGYYQLSACIQGGNVARHGLFMKNGSAYAYGTNHSTSNHYSDNNTTLMYLNGTTDYAEYAEYVSSTVTLDNTPSSSWFTGHLARAE